MRAARAQPTVFIGSSGNAVHLVGMVSGALSRIAKPDPWPGALPQTRTIFESLMEKAHAVDFAVFVFQPEDMLKKPDGETYLAIRDNVLFEFGLFLGALGRERTFAIMPKEAERHLPADLRGVLLGIFNPKKPSQRSMVVGVRAHRNRDQETRPLQARSAGHVFADLTAASGRILRSLEESSERRLAVLASTAAAVVTDVLEKRLSGDLHLTIHLVNPNHPLKAMLPRHWPKATRETLRRLAELVSKPRRTVDCWLYNHVPCVHGFMIDNRELFIGFYRWEDGRLVGAHAPYRHYYREASTEDHFVLFESWLNAPTARPKPLPKMGLRTR